MTEQLPYPEREHTKSIETFCDALEFELSIHPDGEEFRRGINTISKLYEASPLLRSLRQTARLVALAHTNAGYSQYPDGFDDDFYRGARLAMHTSLRPLEKKIRQDMLRVDFYFENFTEQGTYKFGKEELEMYTDGYTQWCKSGFLESLDEEPEEFQELILASAIRMYDDVPNARANEDSFIAGFLMAKDSIIFSIMNSEKVTEGDDDE